MLGPHRPLRLRYIARGGVALIVAIEALSLLLLKTPGGSLSDASAAPYAASAATLAIVLAAMFVIERDVVAPIRMLQKGVASLSSRDDAPPFGDRFRLCELRALAHAVDGVRGQLAEAARNERARIAALRRNDELQAFAYIASHDLREPLRAITAFSDLLTKRAGPELDQKARGYLRHIAKAAARMTELIEGLATYVRAGGDETASMERVTLQAAADAAAAKLGPQVRAAKAEIAIAPMPPIYAPRTPFIQVFENLFSNALKFRADDRPCRIAVSAAPCTEGWRVDVADNGVGFSPDQADRAFQIFQRLHAGGADGQGVGLAIVQKVVSSIGGRVGVETKPGAGSRFWFTAPTGVGVNGEALDARRP